MTSSESTVAEVSPELRNLAKRDHVLQQQFLQAMIADDEVGDEIPNGVLLVLVPDDDEELAEENLRSAMDLVRRGKNAYIRHVYRVGEKTNDQGDPIYSPYPQEGVVSGQ